MRNSLRTIIFCTLVASLVACQALPGGAGSGKALESRAQRITNPDAAVSEVSELAVGNDAFALDFYHAVARQGGNLFFSPYSLSAALAMTYAGARGRTADQMAAVMHYTLPQERLHPAFNALDLQLAAPPNGSQDEQPFQLSIASSLWGQQDYEFQAEFLDLLAMNYGAGLRLLDFKSDPDAARQTINRWVEEQTKERIKGLIPEGGLTPGARLVLANAIYFKADWLYPFEANNTRPLPFHRLDGSQVDTPMMAFEHAQDLRYAEGDGYQAVELPYQGGRTSMLLLVPEAGRFDEFEAGLDAARLQEIVDALQAQPVSLRLPKFQFIQEYALAETLGGMGMPDAFCTGTEVDFSGMDGTRSLCIGQVFHKAFVAVDEKGTEAAAASAVAMLEAAMIIQDVREVIVDRPFIFVIRDDSSSSLLFVGRMLEPAL